MPNSIDFYIGIFLHIIPVRIIFSCFHENVKFIHELEDNGQTSFSDVVTIRNNSKLETTFHHKTANNDWKLLKVFCTSNLEMMLSKNLNETSTYSSLH